MQTYVIPSGLSPVVDKYANNPFSMIDKATSSADMIVNALFDNIENVINEQLEPIADQMSAALEPVKNILSVTGSAIGALAAIASIVPTNVAVVPSLNVEAALTGLSNSLRQISQAIAQKAKDAYNTAKTEIVNLGYPSLEMIYEFLRQMIEQLILYYLNLYCKKYTGYTYIEIRYMCIEGYKLLRELRNNHKKKAAAKRLDKASGEIDSDDEDLDYTGDEDVDKESKKDKAKKKLKEWLDKQNDALWNAFMIGMFIDQFKEMKEQFLAMKNNINLDDLDSWMDYLEQFMNMLYESGALDGIVIENPFDLSMISQALNTLKSGAAIYGAQVISSVQSEVHGAIMDAEQSAVLAAKNAVLQPYTFMIADETNGILELTMKKDPHVAASKTKLVNTIKNSDLFFNSVTNAIVQDAIDYYSGTSSVSERKYTSKSGLYFTIVFIKQEGEELNNDLHLPVQNVASQYSPIYDATDTFVREEDTKRKVSLIVQTVLKVIAQLLAQLKIIRTLLGWYRENKDFVKNGCHLTLANMKRNYGKKHGKDKEMPIEEARRIMSGENRRSNDPVLTPGNCELIPELGIAIYSDKSELDELGSQILRAQRDKFEPWKEIAAR